MSEPIRTVTPSGEPIVILSAHEYDRLARLDRMSRRRGASTWPSPSTAPARAMR